MRKFIEIFWTLMGILPGVLLAAGVAIGHWLKTGTVVGADEKLMHLYYRTKYSPRWAASFVLLFWLSVATLAFFIRIML